MSKLTSARALRTIPGTPLPTRSGVAEIALGHRRSNAAKKNNRLQHRGGTTEPEPPWLLEVPAPRGFCRAGPRWRQKIGPGAHDRKAAALLCRI